MRKPLAIAMAAGALFSCSTTRPSDDGLEAWYFRLQHVPADQVARTLAGEEKHAPGTVVEIAADVRTNSIIVKGSKEDLSRLERRIRELDVQ